MHRLSVMQEGIESHWWKNFCEYHPFTTIDKMLVPFYGRNIAFSEYIEFDTEEDALAFVLRWS